MALRADARVAVIDDDPVQVEANATLVEQAHLRPIPIEGPFDTSTELIRVVRQTADAAVCDHRLKPRGFANFYGAEAVAGLYAQKVPAVLVTQYSDQDFDVTIRRWRSAIPVLIPRDDFDSEQLLKGLEAVSLELEGRVSLARRPYRALLEIKDRSTEGGQDVIDVLVPQWNPQRTVRLPLALIPDALRATLEQVRWLIAKINVDAPSPAELFFAEFEAAPLPLGADELG